MLNIFAQKLTSLLYGHSHLEDNRRSVYVYGFELLLSTTAAIISILIISTVFSCPLSGALFLLVFISLRLFSGGYHASTYGRCFLLTNFVYCLSAETAKLIIVFIPSDTFGIFHIALTFTAAIPIVLLSPVRNTKHPLSETRYNRNKLVARLVLLFWACLSFIMSLFLEGYYSSLITVTLTAVAVMMIIPKFIERRD